MLRYASNGYLNLSLSAIQTSPREVELSARSNHSDEDVQLTICGTGQCGTYELTARSNVSDGDDDEFIEINEKEVEWASLDADVYGAGVYTIIHDTQECLKQVGSARSDGLSEPANMLRVSFSLFGLLINFVMQISLLFFSYKYAVLPSVRHVQVTYREYHAKCFDTNGVYNSTKWDLWDGKDHLCNMVFSNSTFLYIMLVLWWMTMLYEIRECERLFRLVHRLKQPTSVTRTRTVDGEERVMQLACPARYAIYVLIWLPRLFVSCCLLVLGTMWLASTACVEDLILNSVALEFVLEVDKTLFGTILPAGVGKRIENLRLAHFKDPNPSHAYLRSLAYVAFNFGGVVLYLSPIGQRIPYVNVLPQYANDALCPKFWAEQGNRLCGFWSTENCYPYGEQ